MATPEIDTLLARRERLLGVEVPTFYEEPVHIVRGEGVWLTDSDLQPWTSMRSTPELK